MKEKNGQGRNFVNPPEEFYPRNVSSYKIILTEANEKILCTKCQQNYSCENNVTIHMKEIHPDERRKAFNRECLDDVLRHRDYLEWETNVYLYL